jgi:recombinational DNA repair ATPase RecF
VRNAGPRQNGKKIMGSVGIIGLYAENTKRIKVARIQPNGKPVVIVGGMNGQGKSSLLDAIEMTIRCGKSIPASRRNRSSKPTI